MKMFGLHAAHLDPHHLADLHPRQGGCACSAELLDDEHVLECRLELARVDLGPIGRDPAGVQPFPIGFERREHEIVD